MRPAVPRTLSSPHRAATRSRLRLLTATLTLAMTAALLSAVPAGPAAAMPDPVDENPRNSGIISDWYAGANNAMMDKSCDQIAYYTNNQMLCRSGADIWVITKGAPSAVLPGSPGITASAIAATADGTVYAFDSAKHQLVVIVGGVRTVVAGNGAVATAPWTGDAASRGLGNVTSISLGTNGEVYLLDDGTKSVHLYRMDTHWDDAGNKISSGYLEPFSAGRLSGSTTSSWFDVDQTGSAFIGSIDSGLTRLDSEEGSPVVMSPGGIGGSPGAGANVASVNFNGVSGIAVGAGQTTYVASTGERGVFAVGPDGSTYLAAGAGKNGSGHDINTVTPNSSSNWVDMEPKAVAYSATRGLAIYDFHNSRIWVTSPNPLANNDTGFKIVPLFRSLTPTDNLFEVQKVGTDPGGFQINLPLTYMVGQTKLIDPTDGKTQLCPLTQQQISVPENDIHGHVHFVTRNVVTCKINGSTNDNLNWLLSLELNPKNPGGTEADFAPTVGYPGFRSITVLSGSGTDATKWAPTPFTWNQSPSPAKASFMDITSDIQSDLGPGAVAKGTLTLSNYGSAPTGANATFRGILPDGLLKPTITPDSASVSSLGVTCTATDCTVPKAMPGIIKGNDPTNLNVTVATITLNISFVVPIDFVLTKAGPSASTYTTNGVRVFSEGSKTWREPVLWSFNTANGPIPDFQGITVLSANGHPQIVENEKNPNPKPFTITVPIKNSGTADFSPLSLPAGAVPHTDITLPH
ncbi:MAG: hypothetical protein WCP28_08915, partial [Actinomycetes bacterium]